MLCAAPCSTLAAEATINLTDFRPGVAYFNLCLESGNFPCKRVRGLRLISLI
jgi:hypothetical protein